VAIFLKANTRVLIQGISGKAGRFHAEEMKSLGTLVVAGTSPRNDVSSVAGVPVYSSVADALRNHEVDASLVLVPARYALEAAGEAIKNRIGLVVLVSEGVPVHDVLSLKSMAVEAGVRLVGPNTPGIFSPGIGKMGIMPPRVFSKGHVGIISRSGTLCYEISLAMSRAGIGQSTFVGIGGDMVVGSPFVDVLREFEKDAETRAYLLIGEIGGLREEKAAEFIKQSVTRPVVAFLVGRRARADRKMGHAGAIVTRGAGTYESKKRALEDAGVLVVDTPGQIVEAFREMNMHKAAR